MRSLGLAHRAMVVRLSWTSTSIPVEVRHRKDGPGCMRTVEPRTANIPAPITNVTATVPSSLTTTCDGDRRRTVVPPTTPTRPVASDTTLDSSSHRALMDISRRRSIRASVTTPPRLTRRPWSDRGPKPRRPTRGCTRRAFVQGRSYAWQSTRYRRLRRKIPKKLTPQWQVASNDSLADDLPSELLPVGEDKVRHPRGQPDVPHVSSVPLGGNRLQSHESACRDSTGKGD
jgi:hypothetical protein